MVLPLGSREQDQSCWYHPMVSVRLNSLCVCPLHQLSPFLLLLLCQYPWQRSWQKKTAANRRRRKSKTARKKQAGETETETVIHAVPTSSVSHQTASASVSLPMLPPPVPHRELECKVQIVGTKNRNCSIKNGHQQQPPHRRQ